MIGTPTTGETKAPYRVMIVDSDPLQRLALAALLSRAGGFTIICSTGDFKAALSLCRQDQPDLVFIDMVVPWLTGLDLAKEMLNSCTDLSVYVMSAYDYGEVVNHILELNITGFISKPVSFDELNTILSRHKRSRSPRPSPVLEKLRILLKDRNFGAFIQQVRTIANNLQMESNRSTNLLNERLAILRRSLLGERPEETDADSRGELLHLEDTALLSVSTVVELCLFAIVDQAFSQSCVKRSPRLQKVFSYIKANLDQALGLKDLEKNCFISQGHLSRTFKKYFKISVMEYIHIKKLALAKALFLFTEKSVAEVAEMIGYNERSYFGKVFKKYENSTIQQFRQLTVRADTQAALVMSRSHWRLLRALGGQNLIDYLQ
jgi:two-component system response regulator YesN